MGEFFFYTLLTKRASKRVYNAYTPAEAPWLCYQSPFLYQESQVCAISGSAPSIQYPGPDHYIASCENFVADVPSLNLNDGMVFNMEAEDTAGLSDWQMPFDESMHAAAEVDLNRNVGSTVPNGNPELKYGPRFDISIQVLTILAGNQDPMVRTIYVSNVVNSNPTTLH